MEDHTAEMHGPGTSVSMDNTKYDFTAPKIDPAQVLQNFPVLINKILRPLPAKTLNTCARCPFIEHLKLCMNFIYSS